MPITINSTKEEVLQAIQIDIWEFKNASEALKNDREIVLAAVAENGSALQYAAGALRSDKKLVLAALRKKPRAICYVAPKLKKEIEHYQKLYNLTPVEALLRSQLHIFGSTDGLLNSAKKNDGGRLPGLPQITTHLVGTFFQQPIIPVCTLAQNLAAATRSSPLLSTHDECRSPQ